MIVKASKDPDRPGRNVYDLAGYAVTTGHLVRWEITPENSFAPHSHEKKEIWYIADGSGLYLEEGSEYPVEKGDLILIESGVTHGMRTDGSLAFLCMG